MRICNLSLLFALTALSLPAQPSPAQTAQQSSAPTTAARTPAQAPSLTVDRDPVRSPDGEPSALPALRKEGDGYVLHTDVEEVALNCTVLDGNRMVPDLKKENFQVFEDGVQQKIISFQHTDLPVSIALVVDNSGSMGRKRPSVNKSTLDLIEASNPQDEAFVVNFCDEAFIDQDFTSDVNKLREGLSHIEARGGTALYDAVAASADKLATDAKHPKQVIILITDGDDNASTLNLEQTIRRVQQLSGPVIYSIGLLFGDEDMSHDEVKDARKALEMLSDRDRRHGLLSQKYRADRPDCRRGGAGYPQPVHAGLPLHQANHRAGLPPRRGQGRGQRPGQADCAHAYRVLSGGAGGRSRLTPPR